MPRSRSSSCASPRECRAMPKTPWQAWRGSTRAWQRCAPGPAAQSSPRTCASMARRGASTRLVSWHAPPLPGLERRC
eukprot:10851468-Lingulodinium_polyedra.AAC.1